MGTSKKTKQPKQIFEFDQDSEIWRAGENFQILGACLKNQDTTLSELALICKHCGMDVRINITPSTKKF